jgi:hypothetical protein
MEAKTFRIKAPPHEVGDGLTSLRELGHVHVTGDASHVTVSDLKGGDVLFTINHLPDSHEAEVTRVNIPESVTNQELTEQLEAQWKQLADRKHLSGDTRTHTTEYDRDPVRTAEGYRNPNPNPSAAGSRNPNLYPSQSAPGVRSSGYNTLDNRPSDPRSNDEVNRASSSRYNEAIDGPSTHGLRSAFNEFKVATEAAFQRLSTDISSLGRSSTVHANPADRLAAYEGLQSQLRNIRNSFHAFDFGLDASTTPYGGNNPDPYTGEADPRTGQDSLARRNPQGTVADYRESDPNFPRKVRP